MSQQNDLLVLSAKLKDLVNTAIKLDTASEKLNNVYKDIKSGSPDIYGNDIEEVAKHVKEDEDRKYAMARLKATIAAQTAEVVYTDVNRDGTFVRKDRNIKTAIGQNKRPMLRYVLTMFGSTSNKYTTDSNYTTHVKFVINDDRPNGDSKTDHIENDSVLVFTDSNYKLDGQPGLSKLDLVSIDASGTETVTTSIDLDNTAILFKYNDEWQLAGRCYMPASRVDYKVFSNGSYIIEGENSIEQGVYMNRGDTVQWPESWGDNAHGPDRVLATDITLKDGALNISKNTIRDIKTSANDAVDSRYTQTKTYLPRPYNNSTIPDDSIATKDNYRIMGSWYISDNEMMVVVGFTNPDKYNDIAVFKFPAIRSTRYAGKQTEIFGHSELIMGIQNATYINVWHQASSYISNADLTGTTTIYNNEFYNGIFLNSFAKPIIIANGEVHFMVYSHTRTKTKLINSNTSNEELVTVAAVVKVPVDVTDQTSTVITQNTDIIAPGARSFTTGYEDIPKVLLGHVDFDFNYTKNDANLTRFTAWVKMETKGLKTTNNFLPVHYNGNYNPNGNGFENINNRLIRVDDYYLRGKRLKLLTSVVNADNKTEVVTNELDLSEGFKITESKYVVENPNNANANISAISYSIFEKDQQELDAFLDGSPVQMCMVPNADKSYASNYWGILTDRGTLAILDNYGNKVPLNSARTIAYGTVDSYNFPLFNDDERNRFYRLIEYSKPPYDISDAYVTESGGMNRVRKTPVSGFIVEAYHLNEHGNENITSRKLVEIIDNRYYTYNQYEAGTTRSVEYNPNRVNVTPLDVSVIDITDTTNISLNQPLVAITDYSVNGYGENINYGNNYISKLTTGEMCLLQILPIGNVGKMHIVGIKNKMRAE